MKLILAIALLVCLASSLAAQETPRFSFQGMLREVGGDPVPDSDHAMIFRIYSDSVGGSLIWQETHPVIHFTSGRFNAELGRHTPCTLGVFSSGPVFLETQVDYDDLPMTPRLRLGSSPNSATAGRMNGDIRTSPGSMVVRDFTQEGSPSVNLETDALSNSASIRLSTPPDPYVPSVEISASQSNSASIRMFNPQPEPPAKLFEINSDLTAGTSMSFFDDAGEVMGTEPSPFNSGFTIRLFNPQPEPPAVLAEMSSDYSVDGASGKMAVYDPQNGLESRLTPGNLQLQYSGPVMGPPVSLTATTSIARIGIGVEDPGFALELNSSGMDDGMRINSSDGSQLFRVRETSVGSGEIFISDSSGNTGVLLRASHPSYLNGGNVGIGTTNPQGALDVSSTTGAFIVPRMTTAQRDALTPVNGIIIYNSEFNQFNFYENGAWVTK